MAFATEYGYIHPVEPEPNERTKEIVPRVKFEVEVRNENWQRLDIFVVFFSARN